MPKWNNKSANMLFYMSEGIVLTYVFVGAPIIRRPYEILIFNIDEMLSSTNSFYICCMYAHINEYILPTYQVLLETVIN